MSMDFTYVLLGVPSPDTTSRLVSPNAVKPNEHTQRENPTSAWPATMAVLWTTRNAAAKFGAHSVDRVIHTICAP